MAQLALEAVKPRPTRTSGALRGTRGLLALIGIVVAWELVVRLLGVPDYLMPAPSEIALSVVAQPGVLARQIAPTLLETVGGLIVGNLAGLAVAVLVSQTPLLERSVLPLLVGLRSIPIVAITPLLTLVLGRGTPTLVAIVALICFFPIVVNAARGLTAVESDLLELMQVVNASRWQTLRLVRLPAAVPYIFAALRISTTAAVLGAVVAEWLVADQGLGFFIEDSRVNWRVAEMWSGIIATTVLAALGYAVMALLEQRTAWSVHTPKEERV